MIAFISRPRPGLRWIAVGLLLAVHCTVALTGKRAWSTTSDEVAHLVAGHAYWALDDFRLQPENGNLPQRWAALPAWLSGLHLPPADNPAWQVSDQWQLGHVYFYEVGNNLGQLLQRARAMNLFWNVACGVLVFAWTWRLFGTTGAFVALGFFCLDPTFIAHGALATSDTCMTFFFLASLGAWWRHLCDGGWHSGALSAGVFALACVAKFSAVLLLPMFILLLGVRVLCGSGPRPSASRTLLSLLIHGAAAVIVIWAAFGFRYSAAAPGAPPMIQFIKDWPPMLAAIGWQGDVLKCLRAWHALPEAFLFGYNHVLAFSHDRSAFLDGDFSVHGWVRFFPLAFLYKTPLALLGALAIAVLVTLGRWRARPNAWRTDLYRVAPLIVLFVVYGVFSLTTHLNIGQRHILPLYPVFFIFTGILGWASQAGRRSLQIAVAALLASATLEVGAIHPHELAFFNAIAGGPENGHRHLVDSSLDWGQDLPGLKQWLDTNADGQPAYLSYSGNGEPDYYHLHVRRLWFVNGLHVPQAYVSLEPGYYCIGATMLEQVYSPAKGPWTLAFEKEYQDLHAIEPLFAAYTNNPQRRAELERDASAEKWRRGISRFEVLRLARLCHYLRVRTASANIGYSIFVYRLSAEEIAAATGGSLKDWSQLIERTVSSHQ